MTLTDDTDGTARKRVLYTDRGSWGGHGTGRSTAELHVS